MCCIQTLVEEIKERQKENIWFLRLVIGLQTSLFDLSQVEMKWLSNRKTHRTGKREELECAGKKGRTAVGREGGSNGPRSTLETTNIPIRALEKHCISCKKSHMSCTLEIRLMIAIIPWHVQICTGKEIILNGHSYMNMITLQCLPC